MTAPLNRRRFLQRAALAAGALALPARSWAQVPGANSDIRVAVIGFNSRGREHINGFSKVPGVRITALCDCDSAVLASGVALAAQNGHQAEAFTDIRKLLESKNIDAISIATPNHWHALAAVWGMQSGKDVYVEKPVSYDIWEGRQIVAAAEKYKKIVQAGTQSRASSGIREAVLYVREGKLGKVLRARGICYKRRASIGKTEGPQEVPSTVDYDLWSGPAPKTPPRRAKFHYDWHWFWNYGAGDLGNQGVHEMDVARWFLGEKLVASRTIAVGGRFGYEDDAETPNTLISYHDYADAPLIMEVRGLPSKTDVKGMDRFQGIDVGVVIECEGGTVHVPSYTSAKILDKDGKEIKTFTGSKSHFENFIVAVRHRDEKALFAPITEGHRSTALCHLGNISYRLGRYQSPAEIRAQLKSHRDGEATFGRMEEHLAANGIDLNKNMAMLGPMIMINPQTENIVQNKAAYHLWKRQPRKGYVIKV